MKFVRLLQILLLALLSSEVESWAQQQSQQAVKAFEQIKARADKGDAQAQLDLGNCYLFGTGTSKSLSKAIKWHRKAAEQGVAQAQFLLGLEYSEGDGIKQDKIEAVKWIRKAADQGLQEAQLDLGKRYANGEGLRENPPQAAKYFRLAAEQDSAEAQYELGRCYLEGEGLAKDTEDGLEWVRKSAEAGFAPAQSALGLRYYRGEGLPKDYLEAYKWLDLASSQNDEHTKETRVALAGVERFLTPEQLSKAQKMAHDFKPQRGTQGAATSTQTNAAPAITNSVTSSSTTTSQSGVVSVKADDDTYEVFVDGTFYGNTPAKLKLAAGPHQIEVKKAGFKDYSKQIVVTESSEQSLRAVLEHQ
jgi:TPR repeat protein